MSKKIDTSKPSVLLYTIDPNECPFREFRDNELSQEFWGMGPAAFRYSHSMSKTSKFTADIVWEDDQAQPLQRSARSYLHRWVRAEELARNRWDAECVVFEDNGDGKMSLIDMQLSHAQVMLRSSFCRRLLSMCYILERTDGLLVEHQWENFSFNFGTEGWRAKYHIYSPSLKPGGGQQHRPNLSRNGCYLVRLFYLGAWRCIWVSDQVPVDATDSPLLPFSPLINTSPAKPGVKQAPAVTSNVVHLWPMLLCKALLKLAAPDMNDDDSGFEDELVTEFDILHTLTGGLIVKYKNEDYEQLWQCLMANVPVFSWDDDEETLTSTVKSRSTKKPATKESAIVRRNSMTSINIDDTMGVQPYVLPGITPGHEMDLLVTMVRDLPLKKPLPEPDVPLWKTIRWIDWARRHGLYGAYECPRIKFLKLNGLLKLSHAPHLLEVQSTESVSFNFRELHEKSVPQLRKIKETAKAMPADSAMGQQTKEELREWILFDSIHQLIKQVAVLCYPSMYWFTSSCSSPPVRVTKAPPSKALDVLAPKFGPLYLQIDGSDENILKVSLSILSPRVLFNCGVPVDDEIESAYLLLEVFEWFVDCELPKSKAIIQTTGYGSVETEFPPGRHFCRVWVHSRTNWYATFLSESTLLLGTRDLIQCATVRDCPWASKFLSNLGTAFSTWIKVNRSATNVLVADMDFFSSYQPDLEWNPEIVGYSKTLLHWMFRQALQSLLIKRLLPTEFRAVCVVLRKYLCDPNFGSLPKPVPRKPLRDISLVDPCNCVMPEAEEMEIFEDNFEEQLEQKELLSQSKLDQLFVQPSSQTNITSQICELATDDVPCGYLKKKRDKIIEKHEAATLIQAYWRGTWARKCLTNRVIVTPDVMKIMMENAFGNLEALSSLMTEFFRMYPGAKYAYSVASALSGDCGLKQYNGTYQIMPKCKWVPYFQGVFYCHAPVKLHLDIQSTIQQSTVAIYNNDTGKRLPQANNAHITFHLDPNDRGYTVMGHGSIIMPASQGTLTERHWQLTVLSSSANSFHLCDNEYPCKEVSLVTSNKFSIEEFFTPNRRNILGGIHLLATKHEIVRFRAASSSPELKMMAILKVISNGGEIELARCSGVGELYWQFIRLDPDAVSLSNFGRKLSQSQLNLQTNIQEPLLLSSRSMKIKPKQVAGSKTKSSTKIKEGKSIAEPTQYYIELVAPDGWPLTLAQWRRVDEVRNSHELHKIETSIKKPIKEKTFSAKDKDKLAPTTLYQAQAGDPYTELECSASEDVFIRRDDRRDVEFALARKSWEESEPGRESRGAQIRREFRTEFLEINYPPPSETSMPEEEALNNEEGVGGVEEPTSTPAQQGPTPASITDVEEVSMVFEEAKYLTMPDELRDKFMSLYFVPLCTKEVDGRESILVTPEIAERDRMERHEQIKLAHERFKALQEYNEVYVLGQQKERCRLLETLFVDAQWKPELQEVLEERDEMIFQEAQRILSATKKKQEVKKK